MNKVLKYSIIGVFCTFVIGIAMVIVGLAQGAKLSALPVRVFNDNKDKPYSDSKGEYGQKEEYGQNVTADNTSNISSISIDVAGYDVEVVYGDTFGVQSDYNNIRQRVQGNEWKIETADTRGEIFGHKYRTMKITIPENFDFTEFEIDIAGGNLTMDILNTKKLDIDISAANVTLTNVDCATLDISVSAANVDLSGKVTRKIEAECSAGSITLDLEKPSEFNYSIETTMGGVTIDSVQYNNAKSFSGHEPQSGVFYELEADVGTIEIKHK